MNALPTLLSSALLACGSRGSEEKTTAAAASCAVFSRWTDAGCCVLCCIAVPLLAALPSAVKLPVLVLAELAMGCVGVAWVGALIQVWLRPNVVSAVVEGPDIDDGDLPVEEQAKAAPGCRAIGGCAPAMVHKHTDMSASTNGLYDFRLHTLYEHKNTQTSNSID